jgi:hypothetical protein
MLHARAACCLAGLPDHAERHTRLCCEPWRFAGAAACGSAFVGMAIGNPNC